MANWSSYVAPSWGSVNTQSRMRTDTILMAPRTISFTTDYGLADGFVAACHAVIAGLAPAARVIDVTHLVPPGDVRRASHVLAQTAPSFPSGSVHLAVV